MKNIPGDTPDEYVAALRGWHRAGVTALRRVVLESAPLAERLKWGNLVYFANGPVLMIRAEQERLLFGFWRGQRLRDIEPRLKPGGKYEMATLELRPRTPLTPETVRALTVAAVALNGTHSDPTAAATT
jgi:hypothetical protein